MSKDTLAVFRTSMWGRVGHVVMAILPAFCTALTAAGLYVGAVRIEDTWHWLGALALFMVSGLATAYCLGFAAKTGNRIICSKEHLIYRGLLRRVRIPWASIDELWLDFGGRTPFVHLNVRARRWRWWPYHLNASGMTPSYLTLFALARELAPDATVWMPKHYASMAHDSNVPLALRETMVDDALTVVRADAPQAARRSTSR